MALAGHKLCPLINVLLPFYLFVECCIKCHAAFATCVFCQNSPQTYYNQRVAFSRWKIGNGLRWSLVWWARNFEENQKNCFDSILSIKFVTTSLTLTVCNVGTINKASLFCRSMGWIAGCGRERRGCFCLYRCLYVYLWF